MQLERRRDGERYIIEAYGPSRETLEEQRRRWPGSYVQWESQGVPLIGPDSRPRLSGPTFVLWRPAEPHVEPPELEDPAEFLAGFLGDRVGPPPPATAPLPAAPPEPAPAPTDDSAGPNAEPDEAPVARRRGRPPQQSKSVKHKNITRVDRPERKMHGFHVRLGWKGQVYQKWFSDTTHGDRLGALSAAIAWRDAKERELGKPRTEGMLKGQDRTSNTGIVGVAAVTLGGRPYYRALWRDADGRQHRRWFSIERLGEKRALRAAIKAHEQGEAARLQ